MQTPLFEPAGITTEAIETVDRTLEIEDERSGTMAFYYYKLAYTPIGKTLSASFCSGASLEAVPSRSKASPGGGAGRLRLATTTGPPASKLDKQIRDTLLVDGLVTASFWDLMAMHDEDEKFINVYAQGRENFRRVLATLTNTPEDELHRPPS